jgi:capsular exopolysaccharide synthesis family protein
VIAKFATVVVFPSPGPALETRIDLIFLSAEDEYSMLVRRLRYSSSADKKIKSILVSSAGPGEGKTTTVANLAITYANLGKKTLLVDTDLRRPVVHKVLDINKEPGVTDYLSGAMDDFDSLIQKTPIDNLFAVPSGIVPPNPSELLGSQKMANLIQKLEDEWDMILFDSPPLVAVTDATMISKSIDQIVIVASVTATSGGLSNRIISHSSSNF